MYSDLPHIAVTIDRSCDSKIQAIKDLRVATGWGLKRAKEFADQLFHAGPTPNHKTAFIYAQDLNAYYEADVRNTATVLANSANWNAELRASMPVESTEDNPLRGVAHEGAVLALAYVALRDGDLASALSDIRTLGTVTNDATFRAAAVVLEEAHDRVQGKVNTGLLS